MRFLDHAGGNFSRKTYDNINSLALGLLADALEIDVAPPAAKGSELAIKSLGKLHKSVNDARVRGTVLFTCERPMKKELWEHYPDAVARVAAEIHTAKIPEKRNMQDCERDSGLVVTADGRLLVNLYFNHRDYPLRAFQRTTGAWQLVSEHPFDGVEQETPFAEVRDAAGTLIADPDSLWRLFDRHWGRLVIVGDRAVINSRSRSA